MGGSAEWEELAKLTSRAEQLAESLMRGDTAMGLEGDVDPDAVKRLMWTAVKLYVAARVDTEDLTPFHRADVTATEVAITSRAMLRAVQMEVFELGLWHSWGD